MGRNKTSERENELRKRVAQQLVVSSNQYNGTLEQLYRDCADKLPHYDSAWVKERWRSSDILPHLRS